MPNGFPTAEDFRLLGPGGLRKYSIIEIEREVADALSKLAEDAFSVSISKIEFDSSHATFQVRVRSRID